MMNKTQRWFTLVELIVVITILAILGTIGFISLANYSKEARDAKRMQDIKSLLTKLNIENVKGTPYSDMIIKIEEYPKEIWWNDNMVKRWIVDFEYLRENRTNFLDPEFGVDYDFATAIWTALYQWEDISYNFIEGRYWSEKDGGQVIMWNYYKLKESDTETLFSGALVPTPWIWWDSWWNTPSWPEEWDTRDNQECTWKPTDAVWNTTGEITQTYTSWDWLPSTDWVYGEIASTTECIFKCPTWKIYNLWNNTCDNPPKWVTTVWTDLIVSDWTNYIVIQEKNIWATVAWTSSSSRWSYYQWWRNSTSFTAQTASPYDWQSPQNDNSWWGASDTRTTTATNYDNLRKGPCPPWYHVPSTYEWKKLFMYWFSYRWQPAACNASVNICYFTWNASYSNFQADLKIPAAWYYQYTSKASLVNWTSHWAYWASSVNGTRAYSMTISNTSWYVIPQDATSWYRAMAFPIRCFKN